METERSRAGGRRQVVPGEKPPQSGLRHDEKPVVKQRRREKASRGCSGPSALSPGLDVPL